MVEFNLYGSDVRFGSLADICAAKNDVRFTPDSDRKSRHAANGHVCFRPESGRVQCTALGQKRTSGPVDNSYGTETLVSEGLSVLVR